MSRPVPCIVHDDGRTCIDHEPCQATHDQWLHEQGLLTEICGVCHLEKDRGEPCGEPCA